MSVSRLARALGPIDGASSRPARRAKAFTRGVQYALRLHVARRASFIYYLRHTPCLSASDSDSYGTLERVHAGKLGRIEGGRAEGLCVLC